jgi:hypothetical protein
MRDPKHMSPRNTNDSAGICAEWSVGADVVFDPR